MGDNLPTMFRPIDNNWAPLADILHTIHYYDRYGIDTAFKASGIIYLRQGFNGNLSFASARNGAQGVREGGKGNSSG